MPELSEFQRPIIDFVSDDESDQHAIASAYAGSGKTFILKESAQAIDDDESMVICAFNVPIAEELTRRIRRANTEIRTNHSLGLRTLKQVWGNDVKVSDGADYLNHVLINALPQRVTDDVKSDVRALVEKCMAFVADDDPNQAFVRVTDLMYRFECQPKDRNMPPEQYVTWALKTLELLRVPSKFICYSQMLYVPAFHRWSTGDFRWTLVDEMQDLNRAQMIVARNSMHEYGRFFGVGDRKQTINIWNGADPGGMDKLKRVFRAREFKLPISYRVSESVAELVRGFIPDFRAREGAPRGLVAEVSEKFMRENWKPGDMFLSRKNATLPRACLMALSCGVPAYIRGGKDITKGLFDLIRRSRQTNILLFLKWLRKYEEQQAALLLAAKQETKADDLADTVATLIELSDGCQTTAQLQERMTRLFIDEHPQGKLMCSTVHKAKGLEVATEDDTVWLDWSTFRSNSEEEENITYVAQTRAKGKLYMVRMEGNKK